LPAFIGPKVWELEGPIPTLNMSKTLITSNTPVIDNGRERDP